MWAQLQRLVGPIVLLATVMRLLVPAPRGCPEGNGSFVASSTASRVPSKSGGFYQRYSPVLLLK